MSKEVSTTQRFKVYELLDKHGQMTSVEISEALMLPLPTVKRILSELDQVGRIKKIKLRWAYRLK